MEPTNFVCPWREECCYGNLLFQPLQRPHARTSSYKLSYETSNNNSECNFDNVELLHLRKRNWTCSRSERIIWVANTATWTNGHGLFWRYPQVRCLVSAFLYCVQSFTLQVDLQYYQLLQMLTSQRKLLYSPPPPCTADNDHGKISKCMPSWRRHPYHPHPHPLWLDKNIHVIHNNLHCRNTKWLRLIMFSNSCM